MNVRLDRERLLTVFSPFVSKSQSLTLANNSCILPLLSILPPSGIQKLQETVLNIIHGCLHIPVQTIAQTRQKCLLP